MTSYKKNMMSSLMGMFSSSIWHMTSTLKTCWQLIGTHSFFVILLDYQEEHCPICNNLKGSSQNVHPTHEKFVNNYMNIQGLGVLFSRSLGSIWMFSKWKPFPHYGHGNIDNIIRTKVMIGFFTSHIWYIYVQSMLFNIYRGNGWMQWALPFATSKTNAIGLSILDLYLVERRSDGLAHKCATLVHCDLFHVLKWKWKCWVVHH
jgi:hypothetical protein